MNNKPFACVCPRKLQPFCALWGAMAVHCDEDEDTEAALHPMDALVERHW